MHRRRFTLPLIAVVALAFLILANGRARADDTLYTTVDDWSQWVSFTSGSLSASPVGDTDFSSTNGLGNVTAPLSTGTPGALTVQISAGFDIFASPGEQTNAPFLAALNSPTLKVDFTTPTSPGTYFQPVLVLNYNNNFDEIAPASIASKGSFSTATYDLPSGLPTAPSAGLTYFNLGLAANTDGSGSITVDDIRSQAPAPKLTSLFTTTDDWSSWSGSLASAAGPNGDIDGSSTNGAGNTTTGPGNTGTPGALTVTIAPGQTYDSVFSADEHNNGALLSALEGATSIQLDFTMPAGVNGGGIFNQLVDGYFEPILVLNYPGVYDQIAPSNTTVFGDFDLATYTLPAGLQAALAGAFYFNIGIIANTNETGIFTLDNMEAVAPAATSVPLPSTLMATLTLTLLAAGFRFVAKTAKSFLIPDIINFPGPAHLRPASSNSSAYTSAPWSSGARVSLMELLGMRLRKVNALVIVNSRIQAIRAGCRSRRPTWKATCSPAATSSASSTP
jgi:hypothetical protein